MSQNQYDILFDIYKTKTAAELNGIIESVQSKSIEKQAARDVLDYKIKYGFVPDEAKKPERVYTPQYNQNPVSQTPYVYRPRQATKPSQILVGIAIAMLIFFIGGALACFIAAGNISNDEAQMIIGIFGGYALFQGVVIFGVLFGIGQILKNNEEMNEKMDMLINK